MAILKYYNTDTNQWEFVAANPTAKFTTWKKTAAGGETSLSGNDDNSVTLSYTPGLEQVFLNGVLLVRGTDYTATNGTSITGLSALVASDIVSIICYAPFNVGDAVAKTLIDAKGDLLAGTADNTAGRLSVGTNGQVLVANSGETTGLKWNDPGTVGGLVHIKTAAFSGAVSHSFGSDADPIFTSAYRNYRILIYDVGRQTTDGLLSFRLRANTTDLTSSVYSFETFRANGTTLTGARIVNGTSFDVGQITASQGFSNVIIEINDPQQTKRKTIQSTNAFNSSGIGQNVFNFYGDVNSTAAHNGFTLFADVNLVGRVSIYGYKE